MLPWTTPLTTDQIWSQWLPEERFGKNYDSIEPTVPKDSRGTFFESLCHIRKNYCNWLFCPASSTRSLSKKAVLPMDKSSMFLKDRRQDYPRSNFHNSVECRGVAEWVVVGRMAACTYFGEIATEVSFSLKRVRRWTRKLKMFASKIEVLLISVWRQSKVASQIQSGSQTGYTNSRITSVGWNSVVEYDSVVRWGRHGVAGFLSFSISDAKKSPNASAILDGSFT